MPFVALCRRNCSAGIAATAGLLLGATAAAGQPPHDLFGRSLVISWSETEEIEDVESGRRLTVPGQHEVNVYLSELGKLFVTASHEWGGRLENISSHQQVFDTRGKDVSSSYSGLDDGKIATVEFSGNSLALTKRIGDHGIQRISVTFDRHFRQSAVDYIEAYDSNRNTEWTGAATHRVFKRISLKINERNCSIRSGNVHAS